MTDPTAAGARAAAERLDRRYGPGLPSEVEAVLLDAEPGGQPERYIDPISLASLIVSVASLAWSIYSQRPGRAAAWRSDEIVRAVRTEMRRSEGVGHIPQCEVIEVVVAEVIQASRRTR
jgi:hypothetical protein